MLSETRTYRYSTVRLVLLIILLLLLGIVPFVILESRNPLFLFLTVGFIGALILVSTFMLTRSTTISNDWISTRSLLGESTLHWNEIDSVSGWGNGIRLHNRDGDVTVSPSAHLPGYPEVIEIIGVKRPDLFSPTKYSTMSRNWLHSLLFFATGVLVIGAGIYMYFFSDETVMPVLILVLVGLGLIVSIFMSVLSLKIDGPQLTLQYLLGKTLLRREDVRSIGLTVTQTRNGKSYHILMFTKNNRTIRFSGIGPSLSVAYLVLRTWHQANVS